MIALILGYIASVLLAISLMVTNDLSFRWLNTFGCLAFIAYGILIGAFPVILTNTLLLLINVFYLIKIYRRRESFDLLEFEPNATLMDRFISFYDRDIKNYFPSFQIIRPENHIRFVVLRDIVIANVFAATLEQDGTAVVQINYTVPKYRDYEVGRYIFDKEKEYLLSKGVKQIVYRQEINSKHEKFLKVMGFNKEVINHQTCLVKRL